MLWSSVIMFCKEFTLLQVLLYFLYLSICTLRLSKLLDSNSFFSAVSKQNFKGLYYLTLKSVVMMSPYVISLFVHIDVWNSNKYNFKLELKKKPCHLPANKLTRSPSLRLIMRAKWRKKRMRRLKRKWRKMPARSKQTGCDAWPFPFPTMKFYMIRRHEVNLF